MKINIDLDNREYVKNQYGITEKKALSRIGTALEAVGHEVTYIPWEVLGDLIGYDCAIWNIYLVPEQKKHHKVGYENCIHLVYAHGWCALDLDIDGVLYVGASYDGSTYKHKFQLVSPFSRQLEIYPGNDNYILTSGGLFPQRSMHLVLMAAVVFDMNIPIRIVYQPNRDFDWGTRDQHGIYRKLWDFYLGIAREQGKNIIESDAVSQVEFEDLMRRAMAFVYTSATGYNTMVAHEALCYGVPLIMVQGVISYTNQVLQIDDRHFDWLAAHSIAENIKFINDNWDWQKWMAVSQANEFDKKYSYAASGLAITKFIEGIQKEKQ